MKVFVDSGYFIARYDLMDQYHQSALFLTKRLENDPPQLTISDYVYDETMTFLLKTHVKYGYIRAKNLIKTSTDQVKQILFK